MIRPLNNKEFFSLPAGTVIHGIHKELLPNNFYTYIRTKLEPGEHLYQWGRPRAWFTNYWYAYAFMHRKRK